ncbi:MAG: hypothetical protein JW841_17090 [Deltaproteobacteria bacterium]|nr:hypothetical protein [Deltaproteobacteria bacterium]
MFIIYFGLSIICLLHGSALAQESINNTANLPKTNTKLSSLSHGGLYRESAVLEATLDIHRLAMIEIAVAAQKTLEAGNRPDATPMSPLPAVVTEVFSRLAFSVKAKIPVDALPAIVKAYNAEALAALDTLGQADRLGKVAQPLGAYTKAISHLVLQAEEIIDLFSRNRPITTQIIDPEYMLDDINNALDELTRAEASINKMQKQNRPLGDYLQPFLRLEIALGRTLDLIALAQEAGVHIGFEAHLSTQSLATTIKTVRSHLDKLKVTLSAMQQKPLALEGILTAVVTKIDDSALNKAHLFWQAPNPAHPPAVLRVYRQLNKQQMMAFVTDTLTCDSNDNITAQNDADKMLAEVDTQPKLVAEIARGRSSVDDTIKDTKLSYAIWRYRVVPVNAFGIEGKGLEAIASFVPPSLEPPPVVYASLSNSNPASASFYYDGDLVKVSWLPSRNELPTLTPEVSKWATTYNLPVVNSYHIKRVSINNEIEIGVVQVPAHSITDRPTLDELDNGITYIVEAQAESGQLSQSKPCATAKIHANTKVSFSLAKAGIAYVAHPTEVERQTLKSYENQKVLKQALASFSALSAVAQQSIRDQWWTSLAKITRTKLLENWPDYVSKDYKHQWWQEAVFHLTKRDKPWVIVELWFLEQPPYMQREVDRWWNLLDQNTKSGAVNNWYAKLDKKHRQWVDEKINSGAESVFRPVRVLAWLSSRDESEKERINDWWQEQSSERRSQLYKEWSTDLAKVVRHSLRWPELINRDEQERADLLIHAARDLPDGLLPYMLAWQKWQSLKPQELEKTITTEITWWQHVRSWVRYSLRPLDRALGFHLWIISGSFVLIIVLAVVINKKRKQRMPKLRNRRITS